MGDRSGIQWTDATWNPLRGCSRVSEGCRNCYAEKVASRFSGPGLPYEGLAHDGRWIGDVALVEEHLADPLRWQRPRRIFVNSMSDLFHERVPDEWIDRIFAVMALAPQHAFQVLTKRPERMRAYFEPVTSGMDVFGFFARWRRCQESFNARETNLRIPLPNVWLGVSVEDQATADARIPLLLQTPAAVRFVSYEPALGPVDWRAAWMRPQRGCDGAHRGRCGVGLHHHHDEFCGPRLDWIIVGGESGPGARPFDVEWARTTIAQCKAAGVACFVKQFGARPFDGWELDHDPNGADEPRWWKLRDRKGGDPAEWSPDLRVREFPAVRT